MENIFTKPETKSMAKRCEYHSCDFTFEELLASLPETTTLHETISSNDDVPAEVAEAIAGPRIQWDSFFATNSKGTYKPRNYIYEEFLEHLQCPAQYFVEVGCGVGDTLYPLMNRLPGLPNGEQYQYLATDFAENALETLRLHPLYDNGLRIRTACWDITLPFPISSIPSRTDVVLCIFALSALKPTEHIQAMFNMKQLLTTNGKILIRDYGIYDHTYFRHTTRLEENCFMRKDRTIAYYFTLAYMETLALQVGLEVLELSYCSVYSRNRKLGTTMRRNFIHCVLKVP